MNVCLSVCMSVSLLPMNSETTLSTLSYIYLSILLKKVLLCCGHARGGFCDVCEKIEP